jgi:hypothetical protein
MNPKEQKILNGLFGKPLNLVDYLVHWSPVRRYIFVENPKVACTSIKKVLQRDALHGEEPQTEVHDRRASPVPRVLDNPGAFLEAVQDPEIFRFCFVRNPFSRSLSCYLDKMVQSDWERNRLAPMLGLDPATVPSFEQFLEAVKNQPEIERDIHWATQTYLLRPNRFRYSFIGRFEMFANQFQLVCQRLGIDCEAAALGLGRRHSTGAAELLDKYVTPAARQAILEIYDADFRNFGYGIDISVVA